MQNHAVRLAGNILELQHNIPGPSAQTQPKRERPVPGKVFYFRDGRTLLIKRTVGPGITACRRNVEL